MLTIKAMWPSTPIFSNMQTLAVSFSPIHRVWRQDSCCLGWCEQDVCISFWKDDGSSDMMLKVTDICSTDPNDPTHCATPADIKVDRHKVLQMENPQMQIIDVGPDMTPLPQGDQYDGGKDGQAMTWWFFMKCWADVSFKSSRPSTYCDCSCCPVKLTVTLRHRASPIQPTPTIGLPSHLYPTISLGPKQPNLSNGNETTSRTQPKILPCQPIPTAHTKPSATMKLLHRLPTLIPTRPMITLRLPGAKAGAIQPVEGPYIAQVLLRELILELDLRLHPGLLRYPLRLLHLSLLFPPLRPRLRLVGKKADRAASQENFKQMWSLLSLLRLRLRSPPKTTSKMNAMLTRCERCAMPYE